MDLYILNEIQKLKSGGLSSGSAVSYTGYKEQDETPQLSSWMTLVGVSPRYHTDSYTWDNQHPNGNSWYTYQTNAMHNNNACCIPLGKLNSSANFNYGDQILWRGAKYAKRDVVGLATDFWTHRGTSSYMPFIVNVMFIKNPTDTDISTTTLGWAHSSSSDGYDGASVAVWTPNSTGYSGVTGGTWTGLSSYTSQTGTTTEALSFTVPAKTTVMLVAKASFYYWTSAWQGSHVHGYNAFYNLSTLDSAGLECDLDLSQAYMQYNSAAPSLLNTNSTDENLPKVFWEDAAKFFKDY